MTTIKTIIIFAFLVILSINPALGQDSASAEELLKTADDFRRTFQGFGDDIYRYFLFDKGN